MDNKILSAIASAIGFLLGLVTYFITKFRTSIVALKPGTSFWQAVLTKNIDVWLYNNNPGFYLAICLILPTVILFFMIAARTWLK